MKNLKRGDTIVVVKNIYDIKTGRTKCKKLLYKIAGLFTFGVLGVRKVPGGYIKEFFNSADFKTCVCRVESRKV